MALVTKVDVKAYLRRPAGETAEDTLIDGWLAHAKALIQAAIGVPLVAVVGRTWTDRAVTQRTDYNPRSLLVPYPMDVTTLVVKDGDGNTLVAGTDYDTSEVNNSGLLYAAKGTCFANPPYSGTAKIGIDQHPDYAAMVEPILNSILLDLVGEWYQNRRAGASSETDPGVAVTNLPEALPPRVARQLRSITPMLA